MTFYNPNKPKRKHHLKFYTLCENNHWCALVINMCHRNQKGETSTKIDNNADSEFNNRNQVESWERELLQDDDDNSSHNFQTKLQLLDINQALNKIKKQSKSLLMKIMRLLKIMKFMIKLSKIPIQS